MKIINKIKIELKKYLKYYKEYLITNISLLILGICFILLENDIITNYNILYFFITFITGSLLIESKIKDKPKKIFSYFCIIILSLLSYKYLLFNHKYYNMIYIGIIMICLLLFFKNIINNTKLKFNNFIYKSFCQLFITSLIFNVISSGIIFITFLLSFLFSLDSTLILDIQYLLIFGIYIPIYISLINNINNIKTNIFDKTFKYICLPISIISNIIILIYFLKCIILKEIPSNSIFAIILVLFIITYFIVLCVSSFNKEDILQKVNNKYLLIILSINLIIQIYSLYLRINEYGITITRYIGIFIIIIEIILIILYYYKNQEYIKSIIDTLIILSIIMFIIPYINIYELPININVNKINNLDLNKYNSLNKKEKESIIRSYLYLKNIEDIKDYLNKYSISELDKVICKNEECAGNNYYDSYYYYEHDSDYINISSYKTLKEVNIYNDSTNININNYTFDLSILTDYITKEHSDEEKYNYINDNNLISSSNSDLYITSISIDYNDETQEISNIEISGYLLIK